MGVNRLLSSHGHITGFHIKLFILKWSNFFNPYKCGVLFFFSDIGKQYIPKCDAQNYALGLFCLLRGGFQKNEIKFENHSAGPKYESGLTQMILMGKSIHHKWVKMYLISFAMYPHLFERSKLKEKR